MCCHPAVAAAAMLLLAAVLFVIACGMTQFVVWSIASDSSVLFLFIHTRFLFNVPLGSTVACAAPIYL